VLPPPSRPEAVLAFQNRLLLRGLFRPLVGPPLGLHAQRRVVGWMGWLMPAAREAVRARRMIGDLAVDVAAPAAPVAPEAGAILYLHGGAFCLGSAWTHRGLTTRLALAAGMPVWAPDYRLAPEHPYPAALDDAAACYEAMLAGGLRPGQIVIAGDSAGGALAMALVLRLQAQRAAMPAGLVLLSPLLDLSLSDPALLTRAEKDPMVRAAWLRQALAAYACPSDAVEHRPLEADLAGLPPLLVQVGSDEILLSDSLRLAERARACGVDCRLEIHEQRWHVSQLQAAQLKSASAAIDAAGSFARRRVAVASTEMAESGAQESTPPVMGGERAELATP
jgi:acetyl esterase/lipase